MLIWRDRVKRQNDGSLVLSLSNDIAAVKAFASPFCFEMLLLIFENVFFFSCL